jgi:hypothetical protein
MSVDELAPESAAQRELVRILRMALPDESKCREVVRNAMQSAGLQEVPAEPDEIIHFVQEHLAPRLTAEIGPKLVFAFVDDLEAEIGRLKAGTDPTSDTYVGTPTASPNEKAPPNPSPRDGRSAHVIARLPFPKLRESVANLVRTASTKLRAVVASASKNAVSHYGHRPSVVLVHSDRLARASIARALVNARFDVHAIDSPSQVLSAARTRQDAVIVVMDVKADGAESILGVLAMENPRVRMLAWTDAPSAYAETLFRTVGILKYGVLPKTASAIELVDSVRRLGCSRTCSCTPMDRSTSSSEPTASSPRYEAFTSARCPEQSMGRSRKRGERSDRNAFTLSWGASRPMSSHPPPCPSRPRTGHSI